MTSLNLGLRHIATQDLKTLLRLLLQGELTPPLGRDTLIAAGCAALVDRLGLVEALDANALRVVLVAVLAERRGGGQP